MCTFKQKKIELEDVFKDKYHPIILYDVHVSHKNCVALYKRKLLKTWQIEQSSSCVLCNAVIGYASRIQKCANVLEKDV